MIIADELNRIAKLNAAILDDWVIAGQCLTKLGRIYRGNELAFVHASAQRGIKLTAQQRWSAVWWAGLEPAQRDTLHAEAPYEPSPVELQKHCHKTHPEWIPNNVLSLRG